ncbi:TMEM175 family protein [Georgenia sp. SYP-B2076]|uniref:TMEM175 family protein n=1 Tax=Georgenia sp. SYP-B2076 TaxID=2495881 RepID=UPI00197ACA09|nr:TMEM175 family protein [Georgenia sp. SYP-B2076]
MSQHGAAPAGAPRVPGLARRPRSGLLERETSEFDRGLSFFDAIYAFAITLLITNVDVPPDATWEDPGALVATGVLHQLGGFVLGFIVIALFWRVNVTLVKRITAMDPATTTANLVAAAFVILIPFTTQGMSDPTAAAYGLPTAIYAANIALASLAQLAMYEVARRRGVEVRPTTRRENVAHVLDSLATPLIFLASIPVALAWGGYVGKLSWLVLLLVAPLAEHLAWRGVPAPGPATGPPDALDNPT